MRFTEKHPAGKLDLLLVYLEVKHGIFLTPSGCNKLVGQCPRCTKEMQVRKTFKGQWLWSCETCAREGSIVQLAQKDLPRGQRSAKKANAYIRKNFGTGCQLPLFTVNIKSL